MQEGANHCLIASHFNSGSVEFLPIEDGEIAEIGIQFLEALLFNH
jgi:hypothetical protein